MSKDVTQDAFERIQKMLSIKEEDSVKMNPKSFSLNTEEKMNLYQNLLDLVKEPGSPQNKAMQIVKIIDEILTEKADLAKGKTMKGPVFRRADD